MPFDAHADFFHGSFNVGSLALFWHWFPSWVPICVLKLLRQVARLTLSAKVEPHHLHASACGGASLDELTKANHAHVVVRDNLMQNTFASSSNEAIMAVIEDCESNLRKEANMPPTSRVTDVIVLITRGAG